jgi:hypothetical protein
VITYAGGIIFHQWMDSMGVENGLVVSLNDVTKDRMQFGPMTFSGATSLSNGKKNTTSIINATGPEFISPAHLCHAFTHKNYDDWYLAFYSGA